MEWYGKRAYVRQSGLGWGQVESAMLDLLKDKSYIHSNSPRPAVEDSEPIPCHHQQMMNPRMKKTILHQSWKTMILMTRLTTTQYPTNNSEHNKNVMITEHHILTQSYYQSRLDQSRSCETEHATRPAVNEHDRSSTSTSLTPRAKPPGRRTEN